MPIIRVPKTLDMNRACYFELMPNTPEKKLIDYAKVYKLQYGSIFHSRINNVFIFQLPTRAIRDKFLAALLMGALQQGIIIGETKYHPEPISK